MAGRDFSHPEEIIIIICASSREGMAPLPIVPARRRPRHARLRPEWAVKDVGARPAVQPSDGSVQRRPPMRKKWDSFVMRTKRRLPGKLSQIDIWFKIQWKA